MRKINFSAKSTRVLFLSISIILMFIGIIFMATGNRNNLESAKASSNTKVTPVMSNSQSNANVIYIDPGHGGKDPGTSCRNVVEKDINLAIALKVRDQLVENGYSVLMTRDSDVGMPVHKRVPYITKLNPSCVVSIHSNYVRQTIVHGVETYCNKGDARSNSLASFVQESVVEETKAKDRSVLNVDYYLLRKLKIPTALVEVGFLSNDTERVNLTKEEYQQKVAKGIAEGIMKFMPKKNS